MSNHPAFMLVLPLFKDAILLFFPKFRGREVFYGDEQKYSG